jgi:glycine betaine/choline ABC-type transport system substrate-binding protein
MQPNTLEDIIHSAGQSGWEWFEQAPQAVRDQMETRQKLAQEDARVVARAWAEFYSSPDGRKALDFMFDMTLRRTVFFATMGADMQSMAAFGAFREGQNALAHEIARQIGLGLREETKPRDQV